MCTKDILILGPSPFNPKVNHAGGQLTATTNFIGYIENKGLSYDIVDTFRSSFPPPSLKEKLRGSWAKYKELKEVLNANRYRGALVFGTSGLGYWEKLFFSLLIEKKGVKTLFFIRSGHFMQSVVAQNYNVPFRSYLMNKISFIGYQGGQWGEFYQEIGIKEEKLVKILNWIEITEYHKEIQQDRVRFLFVGWIVKEKGVEELVETILEHKDLHQYEFVFVGGGTLLETLKERVKHAGVTNILFTGWQDASIVETYYKKADTLILPSHAEGFPNVVLEALSYKLSIIATNVGGVSESVIDGENGFLIEVNDKEALYRSIQKIGTSTALRAKFSKNSESILKKNHAIEVNCKRIFQLFEN